MDVDREKTVADIKQMIREGTYRVDPKAVAEAIVRRLVESSARSSARSPSTARSSR
jgi:anti-sigma28 factor (negative regulator of flagellin synthesis)